MLQIKDSQFWLLVVSTVLIVLGCVLPYACQQITGSLKDVCKYIAAAILTLGFIGLMVFICRNCGKASTIMAIIGGIMLLGASLTCILSMGSDSSKPAWAKWMGIPAVLGLILLAIATGANGGAAYAAVGAIFIALGCVFMQYQRKNKVTDGLGGPMIGMGWVFLAMAGAAQA
jgi:hypothetical protein